MCLIFTANEYLVQEGDNSEVAKWWWSLKLLKAVAGAFQCYSVAGC
jgi:hypothetical protein